MSYSIHWDSLKVRVKFNELLNSEINHKANEDIYGDARIDDVRIIVWDLLEVEKLNLSSDYLAFAASYDETASSNTKTDTFIVLTSDQNALKLAHKYEVELSNTSTNWMCKFMSSENQLKKYLECRR